MKKLLLFTSLFVVFCSVHAQSLQKEVTHPDYASKVFHNPKYDKGKIQGSPYNQKMFASATVEKIKLKAYMRYNVYADEFEFITPKNDTLILDKLDDFGTIVFNGIDVKYQLTPYVEGKKLQYGYLIDLYQKGDFGLYKKENISHVDEKPAKTTLEVTMPEKFTKQKDSFFLKNGAAGIVEFPDGKKSLIKLFPDKKDAIEAFVKEKKIDFDQQQDRIKIVDFLATP